MCCISSHTTQNCLWQKVLSFCLVSRGQLILPCRWVLAGWRQSVRPQSKQSLNTCLRFLLLLPICCSLRVMSGVVHRPFIIGSCSITFSPCNHYFVGALWKNKKNKKCKRIYCLESTREKWDVLSHSVFLGFWVFPCGVYWRDLCKESKLSSS